MTRSEQELGSVSASVSQAKPAGHDFAVGSQPGEGRSSERLAAREQMAGGGPANLQAAEASSQDEAGGRRAPQTKLNADRLVEAGQTAEHLIHMMKEELARLRAELEQLQRERDETLEMARRLGAEFSNYRKRIVRENTELLARAGEGLVERLLPLIDVIDAAAAHYPQAVGPLERMLRSTLESEGLERIEPAGETFDPAVAEAVEHSGSGDVQVVSEVSRPGYRWKGRLLRPALVKVQSRPVDRGGDVTTDKSELPPLSGPEHRPGVGEDVPDAR